MKASRTHRRVFDLLQKAALKPPPAGATKELEWMFFRSPVSFYAAEDEQGKRRVGGLRFEKTRLEGEAFRTSRAATSGKECGGICWKAKSGRKIVNELAGVLQYSGRMRKRTSSYEARCLT
jgi:hypothetical protein